MKVGDKDRERGGKGREHVNTQEYAIISEEVMKHEFGDRDYAHNFKDFNGNQSLDFFS